MPTIAVKDNPVDIRAKVKAAGKGTAEVVTPEKANEAEESEQVCSVKRIANFRDSFMSN